MTERKVRLCDCCEQRVSKLECPLCKQDMCFSCTGNINIIHKLPTKVCRCCIDKLYKQKHINSHNYVNVDLFNDFPKLNELTDELIKHIKSKIFLHDLEGGEKLGILYG